MSFESNLRINGDHLAVAVFQINAHLLIRRLRRRVLMITVMILLDKFYPDTSGLPSGQQMPLRCWFARTDSDGGTIRECFTLEHMI